MSGGNSKNNTFDTSSKSHVYYISIPINVNNNAITDYDGFNEGDDNTNDDDSLALSTSSSFTSTNNNLNQNFVQNPSMNRRKSILDYPIGSFKGVNSLSRFATSLHRAHSFRTIEVNNDVERSYFKDSNDELYDPQTLAPSRTGRRLSLTLNQLNNNTTNNINNRPSIINIDNHNNIYNGLDHNNIYNGLDHNNTINDYGSISRQTSQPSLLHHSISIANSIRTTNNLNDFDQNKNNENSIIIKKIQDKDGKVLSVIAGQSTAPQTIFNSINVLIGLGLLALPLGLKHAGWIFGLLLLTIFASGTFCSAELLSRCLDTDPTLMSYADLGFAAFGPKGRLLISCLFTLDLLGCGVSLLILFGDSLNALFPEYSVTFFKILGFFIVTPPVFLPLSVLSNISLLGIISTIGTVLLIFVCGLLKPNAPGSLIEVMPTNIWPDNFESFCLSIGLLSASWGGHAVFPNLKSDMRHPEKFKDCLKTTYQITSVTDVGTAIIGFLMFGDLVLGELTTNVMAQAGYPSYVYILLSILMAIIPIAKTPLNARPIISILDFLFNVENVERDFKGKKLHFAKFIQFFNKIFVNVTFVIIAIKFPKFDKLIAFLGAGLCFTICLILPCLFYLRICKATIQPWEKLACKITICCSIVFAFLGIGAAIMA